MNECYSYSDRVPFESLLGKTFTEVKVKDDNIVFVTTDNERFIMAHSQDCCENVAVEDITGCIEDLIGSPILLAEEYSNNDNPKDSYTDSCTWTFYKLATIKGYVDIRWYGESNGYYSEEVELYKQ